MNKVGLVGTTTFLISLLLPNIYANSMKQYRKENAGVQQVYQLSEAEELAKDGNIDKVIFRLYEALVCSKYTGQDVSAQIRKIIISTAEHYLETTQELYLTNNREKVQNNLYRLIRFAKGYNINVANEVWQLENYVNKELCPEKEIIYKVKALGLGEKEIIISESYRWFGFGQENFTKEQAKQVETGDIINFVGEGYKITEKNSEFVERDLIPGLKYEVIEIEK